MAAGAAGAYLLRRPGMVVVVVMMMMCRGRLGRCGYLVPDSAGGGRGVGGE